MKNFSKLFFSFIFFACVLLFCASCKNEIKISATATGINFDYKINSSAEFFNLFFANDSENAGFNSEDVSRIFSDSGFENVKSETFDSGKNLEVKANLSSKAQDPISKSGMIFDSEKDFRIILNKENMLNLYENLSSELQTYLDMLMAPIFTNEEMTNEEYIELVSEVYGQKLAEELANATIKIMIEQPLKSEKNYSIKLVDLLNLKDEITL